jgi:hypothetical protein
VPERGHRTERVVDEWRRDALLDDRLDISSEMPRLADRMLREGGIERDPTSICAESAEVP